MAFLQKLRGAKFLQLLPYIIFVGLGGIFFPSACPDDAHITYWAAYSLAYYGEIINYNGVHIEQSSSLLHTILLAAIAYVSNGSVVTMGSLFSIFCGLIGIYWVGKLSLLFRQSALFSQLFLATAAPSLYWAFGGLEASLVSAIVLLLLISFIRFIRMPSWQTFAISLFVMVLYTLARPEAIFVLYLFLGIVFVVFWVKLDKKWRLVLFSIFSMLIVFGVLSIWRISYFGSIFPQPVIAKVGANVWDKGLSGLIYFLRTMVQYPYLLLFLSGGIYLIIKRRSCILHHTPKFVLVAFCISYASFILASGGDWMQGGRFFVPLIGPGLICFRMIDIPWRYKRSFLRYGIGVNVIFLIIFSIHWSISIPIFLHGTYKKHLPTMSEYSFFEEGSNHHYRDIPTIDALLPIVAKFDAIGRKPVIMSGQAGMIPYHLGKAYLGKFTFIDRFGLSTRHISDCELSNALLKNAFGINLNYTFFAENAHAFDSICGIPLPDIIYELEGEFHQNQQAVEALGYTIIFRQSTTTQYSFWEKWGRSGYYTQFIAVKSDWVTRLGLRPSFFEF